MEAFIFPFGLILIVFFIAFSAYVAWWTLEPINRVAGQLQFSTRFMLSDYLGLMILLQIPLAAAGRAIGTSQGEDDSHYWLLLGLASLLMIVLWLAAVSVVSRAGITRIWRRLCVLVLLVPGTMFVIMAWPLGLATLFTFLAVAPREVPRVALAIAVPAILVVSMFLIRRLAFWSLVGSPGEELLTALKHGRLTTQ